MEEDSDERISHITGIWKYCTNCMLEAMCLYYAATAAAANSVGSVYSMTGRFPTPQEQTELRLPSDNAVWLTSSVEDNRGCIKMLQSLSQWISDECKSFV